MKLRVCGGRKSKRPQKVPDNSVLVDPGCLDGAKTGPDSSTHPKHKIDRLVHVIDVHSFST